jgi:excinuclease UvrABC helicase subunit UvrB
MDKTFDDLFDDFLKRGKKPLDDDLFSVFKNEAKKLIDLIKNFETNDDISSNLEKKIDLSLGKPDIIEKYSDGFFFFEKRVWHTSNGDIVKVIASDNPNNLKGPEKSLQEQLDEAIANEEYEKAAQIRDLMNPPKKKGRPKKSEKKVD